MADVKWIKLSVRLPDNRQLKQIRHLPSGDTIALMWVYLLCLAGDINDSGMIYFTPEIPYTEEMLADQFDMDVNTVRLGLETFRRFGMLDVVDNIMCLPTWEKWQSGDKLSEMREKTRQRVARHREKQRLLAGNVTCNVTVTDGNAVDIDRDIEGDIEDNNTVSKDTVCPTDVERIMEKWNTLEGITPIKSIKADTKRHDMLKKRIKQYGVEAILEAIEQIRHSSFLMGQSKDGWMITFDWFIKPNNFPKVAEGNYADKQSRQGVNTNARQPDNGNNFNSFMAKLAAMRD